MADNTNYIHAIGRRKTAVACVRLAPGKGEIRVNDKTLEEYFGRQVHHLHVKQPLEAVGKLDQYDVVAKVKGGGDSGQAGALRHGIAKALTLAEEGLRSPLKQEGLLTRDPRMKERKKYGQRGARARFQFSKR